MVITFPHIGNLWIPVKALLESMGLDVMPPPPITRKTVFIGARHAPEGACLPLKVTIGNFIEAIEAGADTVLMIGGIGPCRLGYYCELQREILAGLGHVVEFITIEPPKSDPAGFIRNLATLARGATPAQIVAACALAWEKCRGIDRIEQAVNSLAYVSRCSGEFAAAARQGLRALDCAGTVREAREVADSAISDMAARAGVSPELFRGIGSALRQPCVADGESRTRPITVGVVGEIYMVMEPSMNMDICRKLSSHGARVVQPIAFSGWIMSHVILDAIPLRRKSRAIDYAHPYLRHFVGGHGLESVAHSVQMARQGVDGVVHIAPMTCMPEIVAESVLPEVSEREGIPVISISIDEHTGDAGFDTRLEAFCDMLAAKAVGMV
ncbi:MAG: CoA protein activase [Clostridia bacterium]|nr:CoA protein activase [Clostridia bacterium]